MADSRTLSPSIRFSSASVSLIYRIYTRGSVSPIYILMVYIYVLLVTLYIYIVILLYYTKHFIQIIQKS